MAGRNWTEFWGLNTWAKGKDARAYLGVSDTTLARWRKAGALPNRTRWTRAELDAAPGHESLLPKPRGNRAPPSRKGTGKGVVVLPHPCPSQGASPGECGHPLHAELPANMPRGKDGRSIAPKPNAVPSPAGPSAPAPAAPAPNTAPPPAPPAPAPVEAPKDGWWGSWKGEAS